VLEENFMPKICLSLFMLFALFSRVQATDLGLAGDLNFALDGEKRGGLGLFVDFPQKPIKAVPFDADLRLGLVAFPLATEPYSEWGLYFATRIRPKLEQEGPYLGLGVGLGFSQADAYTCPNPADGLGCGIGAFVSVLTLLRTTVFLGTEVALDPQNRAKGFLEAYMWGGGALGYTFGARAGFKFAVL